MPGMGIKLKFLFDSLYVSLEKECFDKFITPSSGSCLCLSDVLIARCSFVNLPLFVGWNSLLLLLLFWCWIVSGPRCWRPLAGFLNGHFDRLSWSFCFWVHHFGFVLIVLFLSRVLQFLLLVVLLVIFACYICIYIYINIYIHTHIPLPQ